jgi:hypothetical protein
MAEQNGYFVDTYTAAAAALDHGSEIPLNTFKNLNARSRCATKHPLQKGVPPVDRS